MLFNICKSANPNTHFVSSASELNPEWFKGVENVGVCGATSTPHWLMQEVADAIVGINQDD